VEVAELVFVDELESGLDAEDGAEDLLAIDAHLGLDWSNRRAPRKTKPSP
jgi:hypothetical protein